MKALESAPSDLSTSLYFSAGIRVGSAEHHVLEEMGEAGQPLLDLVSRAGAHDRVIGDDPRRVKRHRDHGQAVLERGLLDGVTEYGRGSDCTRGSSATVSGAARDRPHCRNDNDIEQDRMMIPRDVSTVPRRNGLYGRKTLDRQRRARHKRDREALRLAGEVP